MAYLTELLAPVYAATDPKEFEEMFEKMRRQTGYIYAARASLALLPISELALAAANALADYDAELSAAMWYAWEHKEKLRAAALENGSPQK